MLVRVSSVEQSERYGIEGQRVACYDFAQKNKLRITKEYVDVVSGKIEKREQFFKLLSEAEMYEAVIVYHLDRIGRSEEVSFRYLRMMREVGLEVYATNRGKVEPDFMTSIEVGLSAEEGRRIIQRTFWGGTVPKARAGELPAGIKAYGYRYVKGTDRAVIVPEEAAVVERIFTEAAAGATHRSIAKGLMRDEIPAPRGNAWWHSVIRNMVQNSTYKGEYQYGRRARLLKEVITIAVPPIVTPELWHEAQPRKRGPRPSRDYALTGHLRCAKCGRSVAGIFRRDKGRVYYRCNSSTTPNGPCGQKAHRADQLEPFIEQTVRSVLLDPDRLERLIAEATTPKNVDSSLLEELDREDKAWLDAYRAAAITADELARYRLELAERRRKLTQPTGIPAVRVKELQDAAQTMPLRELLKVARVTIHLLDEDVELSLG